MGWSRMPAQAAHIPCWKTKSRSAPVMMTASKRVPSRGCMPIKGWCGAWIQCRFVELMQKLKRTAISLFPGRALVQLVRLKTGDKKR